jgi:cyclopropane fatty-acyl-phospholipid synthase-like methyltransferase
MSISEIYSNAHYHKFEVKKLESILASNAKTAANQKLLDVGFGKGVFLNMAQKYQYEVYGVDVNQEYVDTANKNGFKCFNINQIDQLPAQFDIILFSHLIEHLKYEDLTTVLTIYIEKLAPNGKIIILTPQLTPKFYYDFTHEKPYYPQSIRHAFGSNQEEISFKKTNVELELVDIYFFKDSYRTRTWRSYYIQKDNELKHFLTKYINVFLASIYLLSGGRIGEKASWMGVYVKKVRE